MISVLMVSELTDEQIKADIMYKLLRRSCWGAKYLPIDTLVNWMGKQIKGNGKKVGIMIKALAKDGYLILQKRNTTASLNPRTKREIMEFIEKYLI